MKPNSMNEKTTETKEITLPTSREALKQEDKAPTISIVFEDDDDEHRHNHRHRQIKRQHIRRRRRH